jgi:phosphotriesterase-related protein
MNIFLKSIILIFLSLLIWQCSSTEDIVITATGPIPADSMGVTLIHEHILVDFIGADKTGYHRWNRDSVIQKVLPHLLEAKKLGVKTILECTPAFLGRDPKLMRILSKKSGLNILTNTGFYGAVQDKYIPQFSFTLDIKSLADIWIQESRNGIDLTDVHPGFIKISVDDTSALSEIDEKIVRAAIETHRQTGLTIVSHSGPNAAAFAQLKILEEENIAPSAFVWTHAQEGSPEGHIAAAKRGAWISLDDVSAEETDKIVKMISHMKNAGYLNRVLISHDAGWYDPDTPGGGDFRGYTAIFTHLLPALRENGFTQKEIDQLLIENPKNAYTIRVRTK